MRRAHELPLASDIAFMDSTASCDVDNHSITLILTPYAAGAVPLAMIITDGQTTAHYRNGLTLLKEACHPFGFGARGSPKIIVTDDSDAEQIALSEVWPESTRKFCLFHVPQAVWRWLWDSNHGIEKSDRKQLMRDFQSVMRDEMQTTTVAVFEALLCSALWQKYPAWVEYMGTYWCRKEQWCMAWRHHVMHGHHTNNFCEVSIRLYKDIVLGRWKAYNLVAIVDFTCTVMEEYYTRHLLNFSHSRVDGGRLFLQDAVNRSSYLNKSDIVCVDDAHFLVPSEHGIETNEVDLLVGMCTCPVGFYGAFCKHQAAIWKFFEKTSPSFPPVTAAARRQMAILVIGNEAQSVDFYGDFQHIFCAVSTATTSCSVPSLPSVASSSMPTDVELNSFDVDMPEASTTSTVSADVADDDQFREGLQTMNSLHERFGSSRTGVKRFLRRLGRVPHHIGKLSSIPWDVALIYPDGVRHRFEFSQRLYLDAVLVSLVVASGCL